MKMTKEYYLNNVDMGVEFEDEDGFRYWVDCKGSEVHSTVETHTQRGEYLSDVDLCGTQSDVHVKAFLNFVFYNWDNNPNFKGMSRNEVMEKAFDCDRDF